MSRSLPLLFTGALISCSAAVPELADDAGCVPLATCEREGVPLCGEVSDGCGGTLSCAPCTTGPSCTDGLLDGAETDVDCGGTCASCAVGKTCSRPGDCASGRCESSFCAAVPACANGTRDGTETGVDCGGGSCPACAAGGACVVSTDCATGWCSGGVCRQASCTDGAKNQDETGVDCGGSACAARCPAGEACARPGDCASGSCAAGVCAPSCAISNGGCDPNAACANAATARVCACKPGWTGDGLTCTDVNECATANGGCAQTCVNLAGSSRCACGSGYRLAADGRGCDDIDECATGNGGCAAVCTNTPGSFVCGCGPGQVGYGTQCAGRIAQLSTGRLHACAITTAGELLCWGSGDRYRAGLGSYDVATPSRVTTATDWKQVSAGEEHTCAVKLDGTAWCWGDNYSGVLGDGTITTRSYPVKVSGTQLFSSIACGMFHTCATGTDGSLWCWGSGSDGALGPSTSTSYVPRRVGTGTDWRFVTAGERNTCGLRGAGSVECWGGGSWGTSQNGGTQPVGGFTDFVSVKASTYQACGIRSNGTLWCWGKNSNGELGDGTTTERPTPVQIGTASWRSVGGGMEANSTCGVQLDGSLWCWGSNWWGQLGNGTVVSSLAPVRVGTANDWLSASTGESFACAVSAGGASCWGRDDHGQLGNRVVNPLVKQTAPVRTTSSASSATVAVGDQNACALASDGSLWCWGYAHGDASYGHVIAPTDVAPGTTWRSASSGARHTCAVKSDGTLWCIGWLESGSMLTALTQVGTANDWTQVSSARWHSCGLRGGTAWCWDGALMPTQVDTATNWTSLSAGAVHACGLRSDGSAWCWGSYTLGRLGTGQLTADPPGPVRVGGTATYRAISAGGYSTCAVATDGALWCWGSNDGGQLGIGSSSTGVFWTPNRVGSANDWTVVSAGNHHACGLRGAGALWCWGANTTGQLGDGTVTLRTAPVAIAPASTWLSVSASGEVGIFPFESESCAVRADHSVWCWGSNDVGQLGNAAAWQTVPRQVEN